MELHPRGEYLACLAEGKLLFRVPAPVKGATWHVGAIQDRVESRRIRFAVKSANGTQPAVTAVLDGRGATLSWDSPGTVALSRLAVKLADQDYRDGSGFRYRAQFRDGRVTGASVGFDPLRKDATVFGLVGLICQGRPGQVTFDARSPGPASPAWKLVDTRKIGAEAGADDLTLCVDATELAAAAAVSLRVHWIAKGKTPADAFVPLPLDLRRAVNRGLTDQAADDGRGGWTDQGNNDLRTFPTGLRYLLGVPFDVIDPATNDNKTAIILRGDDRITFPKQASVAVDRTFTTLHVLHAAAWAKPGDLAAEYVFRYVDGASAAQPIRVGEDVLDWWGQPTVPKTLDGREFRAAVAWTGKNGAGQHVRVFGLSLRNPRPAVKVASIEFLSAGKPVPIVLAATTSSGDYAMRGRAAGEEGIKLPLPPLRLACASQKAVAMFNVLLKAGIPLTVEASYSQLRDPTDIAIVSGPLSADEAERVETFVREGGRAVVELKPPLHPSLAPLLPFPPTAARVAAGPTPWTVLVPSDTAHPGFSHLPWSRGLFDAPVPPTERFYTCPPRDQAAKSTILAHWGSADGPPAVIAHPVGKGTVLFITDDKSKLDNTKRCVAGYTDYLYLKLYYWLSGHGGAAEKLGLMAAARVQRAAIGKAYADCRAALEDGLAVAQFTDDRHAVGQLNDLFAALGQMDLRTDGLDEQLLALDFSADPADGYAEIAAQLRAFSASARHLTGQTRTSSLSTGSLQTYASPPGPPLQTGIFVTSWPQLQGSLFGDYRHRAFLEHVKDLGFNVSMLYVSAYSRPDRSLLWRWKDGEEGGDVEYLFGRNNLDFYFDASRTHGQKVILTLPYGYPKTPDQRHYLPFVRETARHFAGHPDVLAVSPNNEGVIHRPWTVDDFRTALRLKYGGVAGLNDALGTTYPSVDAISEPKIVSLGGDKYAGEEMRKTPLGSPERALYYEHMLFRMDWFERALEENHKAIKSVSNLHINSRDTPIPQRYNGGPRRLERMVRWHDSIGTHVQIRFDVERSRAYADGKPLWLTEFYWHQAGGGWAGLRYRLHGSLMLPIATVEAQNLAAVTRTFWFAVSRGTELFAIYKSYPYPGSGWWERMYGGQCSVAWPNHVPKRPSYAFATQRRVADRISGDIFGSRVDARVALLEPIASRIQIDGSVIEKATGKIFSEMAKLHAFFANHCRIMTDPQPTTRDFSRYPVLVLPSGMCLDREVTDRLLKHVRAGGTLMATLPPGLHDGHSRPDGRILRAIHVKPQQQSLGKRSVTIAGQAHDLPPAVTFAWGLGKSFAGRTLATYADEKPAIVEAPLAKGRVVLVGFSATVGESIFARAVIPSALDRNSLEDWSLAAPTDVDCLVKRKGDDRLVFLINNSFTEQRPLTLRLGRPHTVIDLKAGLQRRDVRRIRFENLRPGECRILKLQKSAGP